MRGSFMHPELFDAQLFFRAHQQFLGEQIPCEREAMSICELTMRHASRSDQASISEMLICIRQLARCGCVIVTDFPETYLLSGYLRRHSREPVRFVTTVASLAKIIQERFYGDLPGSLLEGMGKLFAANIKLYVAPMARQAFYDATAEVSGQSLLAASNSSSISVNDIVPPRPTLELLQYLLAAERVVELPPQPRDCEPSQRDTKLPRSDADGPFLYSGRNVKIADRGR
jgi:hypothetical protein